MKTSQDQSKAGTTKFLVTLIAATFLMGSSFIAGKVLLADGFPPILLVGWRFLVAALATLPLVLLDGPSLTGALLPKGMTLRDGAIVILIGLTQTAGVMILLFLSMRSISASAAAILLFSNPIWVAVLGRIFLNESLHGARVVGLILGVTGVALAIGIHSDSFSSIGAHTGELIGLGSAFCWSVSTIINKRNKLRLGTWALSFWQMFFGSLVVLAIAYGTGQHWPENTSIAQWSWFFWLAIPSSTGSFGLWFLALNSGGATRTSGYLFLAPLFTVVLSFFILGTTLSWLQALGGVLIGCAIWLVNRELPVKA